MPEDPRTLLLSVDSSGLHSEPGSRGWIITQRSLLVACLSDIKNNRETGKAVFGEIEQFGGWQHLVDLDKKPFRSFEQFCRSSNGLGLERSEINRRLNARELAQDDGVRAAGDEKGGRPPKGENLTNSEVSRSPTSAARIVARLKRDRPDIAQRLAAGEFKSASAAARAAGWKVGQSPLQALRSQWKKASPEERQSFLKEITP